MLNIPETIQALYKTDSVRKNFRVTFPNGEMADLTNQDLVYESVRFSESICSREYFRFGLAESSVVEFETVGVADMRRMTIQCWCEIDTTGLTAAQISAIQAGSWDGTLVLASASDIGYGYFRVPLGTFIVATCPRNQDNMVRRKVTAYSPDYFSRPNIFEETKLRCPINLTGMTYQPYLVPLVLSQLCYDSDAPLLAEGFTKVPTSSSGRGYIWSFEGIKVQVKNTSGQTLQLYFSAYTNDRVAGVQFDNYRDVVTAKYDKTAARNFLSRFDAYLNSLNIDYTQPATVAGTVSVPIANAADLRELVAQQYQVYNGVKYSCNVAEMENTFHMLEPFCYFSIAEIDGTPTLSESVAKMDIESGTDGFVAIYGYGINDGTIYHPDHGQVVFPYYYELTVQNLTTGTTALHSDTADIIAGVAYYTPPANYPLWDYKLTFDPNGDDLGTSSFVGAYSIGKLLNDWLELRAMFASPARIGSTEVYRLSDAAPVALSAGDYREFWWDEHAGKLYGTVRFTIKDGNQEIVVDYQFGNGEAVYDMSDNNIFKDIGMSQANAISFLQTYFVPYIQGLALDSLEMEARGLPYVESSDYLAVTAADGTVFNTFLTRREMSGIQSLTDQMDAAGSSAEEDGSGRSFGTGVSGSSSTPSEASWKKVWENADPTSSFAAQTVALSLSGYSEFFVTSRGSTSLGQRTRTYGFIGDGAHQMMTVQGVGNATSYIYSRLVTVNATGAVFNAGYRKALSSTTAPGTDNTAEIPLNIYAR